MKYPFLKDIKYFVIFISLVSFLGWDHVQLVKAQVQPQLEENTSESGQDSTAKEAPQALEVSEPTPTPTPALELITDPQEYIKAVYKEDFDKAMLVLKGVRDINGNDICGGENRGLRPEAVNTNKDGSKDWNLFQINDKWHPVKELNLDTDWKANVDYSYRMFKNDGHTFSKRWVAGACIKDLGYEI